MISLLVADAVSEVQYQYPYITPPGQRPTHGPIAHPFAVSEVVDPADEATYIAAVMLLSLLIGLLHVLMAALRLGAI